VETVVTIGTNGMGAITTAISTKYVQDRIGLSISSSFSVAAVAQPFASFAAVVAQGKEERE